MAQEIPDTETPAQRYRRLAEKEAVGKGFTAAEAAELKEAQVRVGLSDHIHDRDQQIRRLVLGGLSASADNLKAIEKAEAAATEDLRQHREKNRDVFQRFDDLTAELAELAKHRGEVQQTQTRCEELKKTRRDLFGV